MPETPEIDTDRLHEQIREEVEKAGGTLLRRIALTTALLAALAAIAALEAGANANEALVRKTEATVLQARASDQWAYFQAKEIKGAVAGASRASFEAAGKDAPAEFGEKEKRYVAEAAGISEKARALEKERDAKSAEADHLLHRHHGFAQSVALFQVAIALGAIAALTRSRPVWLGSLLLGGAAVVLLAVTFAK